MSSPSQLRPQRVLIISADMGEGHNAAAQALTETISESWPGCEVECVDTMQLWGARFAQATQRSYGYQLSAAPWSYAASYDWLSRYKGVVNLSRRAIGTFFGPRLANVLKDKRPDLVISTYPFGSAALDWLRARRGLDLLTVTYIPAFHVHPLWVYPGIDLHFVMYDSAHVHALLPGFETSMRLGAPPVKRGFGSFDQGEARCALGIAAEDFVVLMTGGAWGVGGIGPGVEALVGMRPAVHVVAVCGKNTTLEANLRQLADANPGRLTVFGYVSNMPELMAASNVVVTNGAGVTVLEALMTPRPVIAFAPLAGHGTASTLELVRRDLAVRADNIEEFVGHVHRLRTDPEQMAKMQRASEFWAEGRDLTSSVAEIEGAYISRVGLKPSLVSGR